MTKRESVWLLIRLAGVYLVYLAVITFFTLISSGWGLIFAPPKLDIQNAKASRNVTMTGIQPPAPFDPNINPTVETPVVTNETLKPEDKAKREATINFLWQLLLVLIYGSIGFYFLRDGRVLLAVLMREDSDYPKKSEPEVTTLNL